MKSAASAILALSGLGFTIFLAKCAVVSVETPPGMLNPGVHIELLPGRRIHCLVFGLWMMAAAYFYVVVAWTEQRLGWVQSRLSAAGPDPAYGQPPEVRRLKEAIRTGNIFAIGEYATEDALAFRDDRLLTPYELAELYGNEAVTEAVRDACRRHLGGGWRSALAKAPESRFALGRQPG